MFAIGTKIYLPFLTDAGKTILSSVSMTIADCYPFDIQIEDTIVAILIIKGYKHSSLRKWLAQHQLSPDIACAYSLTYKQYCS